MPTLVSDSKTELNKKLASLKKKGYPGVHKGRNWGGRKKYFLKTVGKPSKNKKSKVYGSYDK